MTSTVAILFFGKMTIIDKPPLSSVDFCTLTHLGRLQVGTRRCLAEISSQLPDDGGGTDVRKMADTRSIVVERVLQFERQNANKNSAMKTG